MDLVFEKDDVLPSDHSGRLRSPSRSKEPMWSGQDQTCTCLPGSERARERLRKGQNAQSTVTFPQRQTRVHMPTATRNPLASLPPTCGGDAPPDGAPSSHLPIVGCGHVPPGQQAEHRPCLIPVPHPCRALDLGLCAPEPFLGSWPACRHLPRASTSGSGLLSSCWPGWAENSMTSSSLPLKLRPML